MSLLEKLNADLKNAMRERNKEELGVLRLITAAIKQVEVDERISVDEIRLITILDKMVKQRKESIVQFQQGGREDLVEQEQFELTIINRYLPEPLSETEVARLIDEALSETQASKISDMGKVMERLKPQLQGRADLSKVSGIVKSKLS